MYTERPKRLERSDSTAGITQRWVGQDSSTVHQLNHYVIANVWLQLLILTNRGRSRICVCDLRFVFICVILVWDLNSFDDLKRLRKWANTFSHDCITSTNIRIVNGWYQQAHLLLTGASWTSWLPLGSEVRPPKVLCSILFITRSSRVVTDRSTSTPVTALVSK